MRARMAGPDEIVRRAQLRVIRDVLHQYVDALVTIGVGEECLVQSQSELSEVEFELSTLVLSYEWPFY